ncbi:MAG: C-terminal helicase domain-containing protein [Bacillales bacterium]|nr:C-terminal helicase domain-containing protein [Bacillales bacterium]
MGFLCTHIKQYVYYVQKKEKSSLLIKLIKSKEIKSALVFTRTKRGANKVVIDLQQAGIGAEPIHANKSQSARERALNDFKLKRIKVLVATDIASRGIDVNAIEYVFNFDLPEVPETYIHRIGRTGRAGLSGISISFCAEEEKHLLEQIIKHIKLKPEVVI